MQNTIYSSIQSFLPTIISWRHQLHQNPELGFKETYTSQTIKDLLDSFGIQTYGSMGKTGIIGVLTNGSSDKSIALRADIDALPIQEETGLSFASTNNGVMHACGHDGHTAILLAAAKYLSETKNFDGKICFIFQPSEEANGGALALIRDGLFDKFKIDQIYGLHNASGIDAGLFLISPGSILASHDDFDIELTGPGGHAAFPQPSSDIISIGAELVTSLKNQIKIFQEKYRCVFSVTQIHAGNTYNVFPQTLMINGTYRCLTEETRISIKKIIEDSTKSLSDAYQIANKINIRIKTSCLINSNAETKLALQAAQKLVDADKIITNNPPAFASDDFAEFLQYVPGCYISIGNGPENNRVHTSKYQFSDDILVSGAAYWAQLAEDVLK